MLKAIGNTEKAQLSSQLSVVGVALVIELLELDDAESCLCEVLGVLLSALPDGAGEAVGSGADGGVEGWIEGEDGLSRCRRDWQVLLLGDTGDEGGMEGGGSICRWQDFCKSGAVGRFRGRGDARHVAQQVVHFIGEVV